MGVGEGTRERKITIIEIDEQSTRVVCMSVTIFINTWIRMCDLRSENVAQVPWCYIAFTKRGPRLPVQVVV